jgi:hypothetical protein
MFFVLFWEVAIIAEWREAAQISMVKCGVELGF